MTRVYCAADRDQLMQLAEGKAVTLASVHAESEDEEHEYEAMLKAAELGDVVVTAEVADGQTAIKLEDVESFHLDADDSGDLSWFARQELVSVIEMLST